MRSKCYPYRPGNLCGVKMRVRVLWGEEGEGEREGEGRDRDV